MHFNTSLETASEQLQRGFWARLVKRKYIQTPFLDVHALYVKFYTEYTI